MQLLYDFSYVLIFFLLLSLLLPQPSCVTWDPLFLSFSEAPLNPPSSTQVRFAREPYSAFYILSAYNLR